MVGGRRGQQLNPQKSKALDSGVRKVEGKEKRQDQRGGKQGKQVRSTGRTVRQGWKEGA